MLIMLTLLCHSGSYAREVHLHFPHFAGHAYDWTLFQGDREVIIMSGEIDPEGRVLLVMPDAYHNYRGMTRWLLNTGGGLDMIYTGRGFAVECLSEHPSEENIIYTGNPENDFLRAQSQRQQAVLEKIEAVSYMLQVYPPTEELNRILSKEQKHLYQQFESLQADRAKSPLYAARFSEIVDFTRGIADKLYDNPDDHQAYFNDFISNTLNFEDLYTSGHWDQVVYHWLMMNVHSRQTEQAVADRLDNVLRRMTRDDILAEFAEKAVLLLVEKGKDGLLPQLVAALDKRPAARAALSSRTQDMLSSFKILKGTKAPDLVFSKPVLTPAGVVNQNIILKTDSLEANYTILLFYRSDCQPCEDVLIALSNRYSWLKAHDVRVIAISADETEEVFEAKLMYHQWSDTFCDLTGVDGPNFKNYAVLGTPALYLLNRKGVILKKSAYTEELFQVME